MSTPPRYTTLAYAEIGTGIGIAVFWLLFFTLGMAPANPPACYFAFEHAFPLPDLVLAAALLIAGYFLAKGSPWGPSLSLPCAGGLLFLGLVDFSFNVQNGIYSGAVLEGILAAAMNLWCVALGIAMIIALSGIGPSPRPAAWLARSNEKAAQ